MTAFDRELLRTTFDQDAELYDRARPGYPPQLFDDLVELAGIGPGCRVLEIGPGTGQATLPLAKRGCTIIAVELGAAMADVLRCKVASFPSVQIVVSAFEIWPLPPEPFDLVLSATAFHWLDPAVRVTKVADALRPGGALATIATHHVAAGDVGFFEAAQECYERWDPDTPPGGVRLPPASEVMPDAEELGRSGRFGPAIFRRYEWEQTYTSAQYLDLLLTYSGHRALELDRRESLLRCIAHLIESRFGGRIRKGYLTELRLAPRLL